MTAAAAEPSLEEGTRRLEQAMLPSGGWGYHPAGQPFVEPTALALLALAPRRQPPLPTSLEGDQPIARSLRTILSWQGADGHFGTAPEDPEPSWATAPALLALAAHGHAKPAAASGVFLAQWRVPESPPSDEAKKQVREILRIDLALRGWPWQAREAFATVEPTSLACIALRAWGDPAGAPRIAEGARLLENRVCPRGGWNYGNPYFFGDEMPPITLPTAKALLALLLCGKSRDDAVVAKSLAILAELLTANPSRRAHAWGAFVFAAAGKATQAGEHARSAVDPGDGHGPWGGRPDATALALLALRAAGGSAPTCLTPPRA